MKKEFIGKIGDINYYDSIYIGDDCVCSEVSDYFHNGATVFVSHYISDVELETKEDFLEANLNSIIGAIDSGCSHVYGSEYTGYMWTEEGLKVGDHDIYKNLESNNGKYCYLRITDAKSHRNDIIGDLLK